MCCGSFRSPLQEFTQSGGAMPSPLDLHFAECLPRGFLSARRDRRLREFPHKLLFASLLLCVICTSCGAVGSGPASPPPPVTVAVTPNSAQPFPGVNVQFNAVVQNATSSAVNWQVNQAPGGNATVGTISSNGFCTAPNSVPNPATVTVTAVLQADSTKTGSASVTIQSLSAIQGPLTLSPALSSVTPSQTLQLNVLTAGVGSSDGNWAVVGISNGSTTVGIISTTGAYSPPSAACSHLITAILQANPSAIGSAQVEVTDFPGTFTWRNDNSRSGLNAKELALAPATVTSAAFGKLFSCPLDGYAYAQPLYVANLAIPGKGTRNVVFVATELDSVFAFDADSNPCVQLWHANLVPTGSEAVPTPNLNISSTDIAPFVGITGTPVINVSTSTLYVVAEARTTISNPTYSHLLYALDLATGQTKLQSSGVPIGSSVPGFSSVLENQRAALLLDNNTVYIAFGSHHGQGNYHGWLLGHDSSTIQPTLSFNTTPNG